MKSRQYTIRSVPPHIDRALRQRARKEHKSLNQVILDVLDSALQPQTQPKLHHDLDFMIGTWVEDPAFDKAMEDFERVDEETSK